MEKLYHALVQGLAWNTVESMVYQALLIIHYFLLYHHTDATLFGMIGVIFSLLYLTTFLANLGLDTALAPYAQLLTTDRYFWHTIIMPHVGIQFLIYLVIGILFIGINAYVPHPTIPISCTVSIMLAFLLISEATKKTLRTIAHLTFYNKLTALTEISALSMYVATVWIWYFLYKTISLSLIFLPLLITSLLSCLILGRHIYDIYTKLPVNSLVPVNTPTHRTFISTRLYTYGIHLGHTLFSSNFLVPFFAVHIGLAYAGVFKLISSITHSISSMIHKIFGPTSQALFSHMIDSPQHEKQKLFSAITEYLHHLIYGLIIFFSINHTNIIGEYNSLNTTLISLFLIIQLTEYTFIVYEKFFIAHHRSGFLCILSLMSLIITGTLLTVPLSLTPITLMSIVLGIRMLTIGIMGMCAYHFFQIKPAGTLKCDYLLYALGISLIFFVCF